MKRWQCWLVLGAVVFWTANASAAENPALNELRAKWDAAAKDVQDITAQEEMRPAAGSQPMAMTFMRKGEKWRQEVLIRPNANDPPITSISVFDGADMWGVTPGPELVRRNAGRLLAQQWQAWPNDAHTAGSETVAGRDCIIVEFKEGAGESKTRLWVDRKLPTLVKSEISDGPNHIMVTLYSDFRKVYGDYEMPFKIEYSFNGKPMKTTIVKSIRVNSRLADELFDPQSPAAKKLSSLEDVDVKPPSQAAPPAK